jgi:predicted DNA binding CopG/RHH family protein
LEREPDDYENLLRAKKILDSLERGEWRSARAPKRATRRYSSCAKATFRKDRRLNIRISTKNLEAIQKRALEEGSPIKCSSHVRCTGTRLGGSVTRSGRHI